MKLRVTMPPGAGFTFARESVYAGDIIETDEAQAQEFIRKGWCVALDESTASQPAAHPPVEQPATPVEQPATPVDEKDDDKPKARGKKTE